MIFEKLKIVLDEGKIVVSQYLSGIPLGAKKILLDDCSRLVLKSDSSSSNAFIFKNNGRIQAFQMNPVAYSIKIQRDDGSDDILSSGNYLLMLKLFQQIADRYAALTPEIDTNNEKMLFGAYRKRIHFIKKRAALMLSILCAFAAMIMSVPLLVEYINHRACKNWVEIQGKVEKAHQFENGREFRVAYEWKGKNLHTSLQNENFLSSKSGQSIKEGNYIPVYVNPKDPNQYTFGYSGLGDMIKIVIGFCLFLVLSILLFQVFLRLKRNEIQE